MGEDTEDNAEGSLTQRLEYEGDEGDKQTINFLPKHRTKIDNVLVKQVNGDILFNQSKPQK